MGGSTYRGHCPPWCQELGTELQGRPGLSGLSGQWPYMPLVTSRLIDGKGERRNLLSQKLFPRPRHGWIDTSLNF